MDDRVIIIIRKSSRIPRLWKILYRTRMLLPLIVPHDYRKHLIFIERLKKIDDYERLLIFASTCGYEKIVEWIVRQRGSTGYFCNNQALEIALEHGRPDIVTAD